MALRIRAWKKNKKGKWAHNKPFKIVCAADQPKKKGDIYIDDDLHYFLAVIIKIIYTKNKGKTWYFKKI